MLLAYDRKNTPQVIATKAMLSSRGNLDVHRKSPARNLVTKPEHCIKCGSPPASVEQEAYFYISLSRLMNLCRLLEHLKTSAAPDLFSHTRLSVHDCQRKEKDESIILISLGLTSSSDRLQVGNASTNLKLKCSLLKASAPKGHI